MPQLFYPSSPAPLLPPAKATDSRLPRHDEEMFPVVEPSGVVTGRMRRSYAHSGAKCLHPVVHLHIINRYGEIYLQRRALDKDLLPGFWDTAVGGHVTYGESPSEALYREAAEELALYDFNPVFVDSYVFESSTERELVFVWAAVGSFDLHPDGHELAGGRWWSAAAIEEALGKDKLTPNFEGEYARYGHKLQALL